MHLVENEDRRRTGWLIDECELDEKLVFRPKEDFSRDWAESVLVS